MAALSCLIVEVALVLLSALMLALANKDIATPEWDLEWLCTLPAPTRTLLAVRILERTLVNPFGIIALWPFLSVLAHRNGHGYASPLLGALLALPLLALAAAPQTIVDTGFRLRMPASRLRNLQALFTIVGTVTMYLVHRPDDGARPALRVAGRPARVVPAVAAGAGRAGAGRPGRALWVVPLLLVQVRWCCWRPPSPGWSASCAPAWSAGAPAMGCGASPRRRPRRPPCRRSRSGPGSRRRCRRCSAAS